MSDGIMHSHFELVNSSQVTAALQQHSTPDENQKQFQGSDSGSEKVSVAPDINNKPSNCRDKNQSLFILVCIGFVSLFGDLLVR
jgi:hypothetical protein